jgi:hypothetical protein
MTRWTAFFSLLCLFLLAACNLASPTPSAGGETEPPSSLTAPSTGEAPFPAGHGQTYYISLNWDDAYPGTREHLWASPGYGSRQLHPGDTLSILCGRYILREYDADIITPHPGSAGCPAARLGFTRAKWGS